MFRLQSKHLRLFAIGSILTLLVAACAPAASPTPAAPAAPAATQPAAPAAQPTQPAAQATTAPAAKPAQETPAAAAKPAASGTIKIGVFGPLSGDAANNGQMGRDGVNLLIDAVNANGGVNGAQIQVIHEDDAGRPEQAVSICNKFVAQDQVQIVLGGVSSPTSIACAEVTQRAEIPQIITGGTAARITQQNNPFIFRIPAPDTRLGIDVARLAQQKGWNKIALIHVNDDFGNGGAKAVTDEANQLGLQVVADESYTRGDRDFTAQLSNISRATPDVLVDWSRYTEGSLVAQQARALGIQAPLVGSDGICTFQYAELAGDASEGVICTTHWIATSPDPASMEFLNAFKAKYNRDPDYMAAQGYSAALLAVDALKRAGSTDPKAIRDAIAATSGLSTPKGELTFQPNGDPTWGAHLAVFKNKTLQPFE